MSRMFTKICPSPVSWPRVEMPTVPRQEIVIALAGPAVNAVLLAASLVLWMVSGVGLFLLVGASILLPLILAYTAYSYWVFRGKIREGEGYH